MNAKPHLGHALEFVEADAIARAKRLVLGKDNIRLLSGSDENAQKNVVAAEALGITTQELVDRNSAAFRELLLRLGVTNDDFIRTTEERHIRAAQALWQATDPQDIYKKSYSGLYCVGCEEFKSPEDLVDGECPEHPGKTLETVEEENYFFNLKRHTDWLKKIISSDELRILPASRKNEMLGLIERGLEDFSISRPAARTKGWGVQVPGDETQTMYVWYDALANYIAALGYPEKEGLFAEFWSDNEERGHILGKGVNRFHTIYWPAMLRSAGLKAPRFAYVHGYVTLEGQKISKTLGNVIDPDELIEEYGVDAVRYYLLREIRSTEDGDFSRSKMTEAYNANLANGIGNLAARVMKMAVSYSVRPDLPSEEEALHNSLFKGILTLLDRFEIDRAMDHVWQAIGVLDQRIADTKPFTLIKTDEAAAKSIVEELVRDLFVIAVALQPFLPDAAGKIMAAVKNNELPPTLFPRK